MSKADELLRQVKRDIQDYFNNELETYTHDLLIEIEDYLNRKEKLTVGSEWVCDVGCLSLTEFDFNYFDKGDEVKIIRIDSQEVYLDCVGNLNILARAKMPIKQFPVCFRSKEIRNDD